MVFIFMVLDMVLFDGWVVMFNFSSKELNDIVYIGNIFWLSNIEFDWCGCYLVNVGDCGWLIVIG